MCKIIDITEIIGNYEYVDNTDAKEIQESDIEKAYREFFESGIYKEYWYGE